MGNEFQYHNNTTSLQVEHYVEQDHSLNSKTTLQVNLYSPAVQQYLTKYKHFQDKMVNVKTFKVVNKNIYHAPIDQYNNCNGFGKIIKNDKSVMFGQFTNDKINGQGLWIFKDGATYKGNVHENVIEGAGIYSSDKVNYIGMFKNGKFNGHGKIILNNQFYQFEGQFQNGEYKNGRLTWETTSQHHYKIKCIYQGQFNKNGQFQGYGKLKNQFGEFVGGFLAGQKHGEGKFYFQNGLTFIGNYINNKRKGFGTIYNDSFKEYKQKYQQKDDLIAYKGQFTDDLPHGDGAIYDAKTKKMVKCKFVDGINYQSRIYKIAITQSQVKTQEKPL